MSRKPLNLAARVARVLRQVKKLERKGFNRAGNYGYPTASDVFEAVRDRMFADGILLLPDEATPEYVDRQTNGGELLQECRLTVTYTFSDGVTSLPSLKCNGAARDLADKALYKAQTGAEKAFLKRVGLMAEEVDDPEWDSRGDEDNPTESLDDVAPMHVPSSQRPVTPLQISAFQDACAANGKTADEISHYLAGEHKVDAIEKLKRGRPFTAAIRWASDGKGTLAAPKPQAVPSQGSLALRTAPKPVELKIGNKTVEFEPTKSAYSV